MKPVTSSAGVTSNAGLRACDFSGAILTPFIIVTSSWDLCSMTISSPLFIERSNVEIGAAT